MLGPDMATKSHAKFLRLIQGRVRELGLTTEHKQFAWRRGTRFKAPWKLSRKTAAGEDELARDRDTAVSSP